MSPEHKCQGWWASELDCLWYPLHPLGRCWGAVTSWEVKSQKKEEFQRPRIIYRPDNEPLAAEERLGVYHIILENEVLRPVTWATLEGMCLRGLSWHVWDGVSGFSVPSEQTLHTSSTWYNPGGPTRKVQMMFQWQHCWPYIWTVYKKAWKLTKK